MLDGTFGTIALGFDGFALCAGLGVLTPRARRGSLALAFGLCDAAATALGALLTKHVTTAVDLEWPRLVATLVVAGAALGALVVGSPPRGRRPARAWFCLPLAASLDNLLAGARSGGSVVVASLAVAVASAALAYAGLSVGALVGARRWGARAAGSAA